LGQREKWNRRLVEDVGTSCGEDFEDMKGVGLTNVIGMHSKSTANSEG
jgi:hypothetical protein